MSSIRPTEASKHLGLYRERLRDVIVPLYLAPLRVHLQYCVKVCPSYYKEDMDKLNPRQALQAGQGAEYLLCGRELGLFSLEKSWRAKSRLTAP